MRYKLKRLHGVENVFTPAFCSLNLRFLNKNGGLALSRKQGDIPFGAVIFSFGA